MPLSGAQVTQHGPAGGPQRRYGDFESGKAGGVKSYTATFTRLSVDGAIGRPYGAFSKATGPTHTLIADGGVFELRVADSTSGYAINAAGGAFVLTGGAAGLRAARRLEAAGGAFALAGGVVGLGKTLVFQAAGGAFALAGGDATLTKTTIKVLTAEPGAFALTGGAVGLKAARRIAAGSATFTLTGGPANFVLSVFDWREEVRLSSKTASTVRLNSKLWA